MKCHRRRPCLAGNVARRLALTLGHRYLHSMLATLRLCSAVGTVWIVALGRLFGSCQLTDGPSSGSGGVWAKELPCLPGGGLSVKEDDDGCAVIYHIVLFRTPPAPSLFHLQVQGRQNRFREAVHAFGGRGRGIPFARRFPGAPAPPWPACGQMQLSRRWS